MKFALNTRSGSASLHLLASLVFVTVFLALSSVADNAPSSKDKLSERGRLELKSGEFLWGSIRSMDAAAGQLGFVRDGSGDAVFFKIADIDRFTVRQRQPARHEKSEYSVYMANGDVLIGNIISMAGDELLLSTWYAGEIKLDRCLISMIASRHGYHGFTELGGWLSQGNIDRSLGDRIVFRGNNSAVSRKLDSVPESIRMDFRIRSFEPFFLRFLFLASKPTEFKNLNAHEFILIPGRSLLLVRREVDRPMIPLTSVDWPDDRSKTNQKEGLVDDHTIIYDREKQQMMFFMNGDMIGSWSQVKPHSEEGEYITIQMVRNAPVELIDFSVSEWNGIMPNRQPDMKHGLDIIEFHNGDVLGGDILEIESGRALVKSAFGQMWIPLDRISNFMMRVDVPQAWVGDMHVTLTLRDGTSLAITPQVIENGDLIGNSFNIGSISVPLKEIRSMSFNLNYEIDMSEQI